MANGCNHDKHIEFTPKEVCSIFQKSYVTVLKWLGDRDANEKYSAGVFPHAYKCQRCRKIYIPAVDVETKMEEYRKIMKGV